MYGHMETAAATSKDRGGLLAQLLRNGHPIRSLSCRLSTCSDELLIHGKPLPSSLAPLFTYQQRHWLVLDGVMHAAYTEHLLALMIPTDSSSLSLGLSQVSLIENDKKYTPLRMEAHEYRIYIQTTHLYIYI
jgi:hypothetical protein